MPELASVRLAATTNITAVDGGALPVIDGVQVAVGDDVLLVGQTAGERNGIYTVPSGGVAWTRRTDTDTAAEFIPGMWVFVRDGTVHGGSNWQFKNASTPTLGVTILNFRRTSRPDVETAGTGVEVSSAGAISLPNSGAAAGTYGTHTESVIDAQGRITSVMRRWGEETYIEGLVLSGGLINQVDIFPGAAYIPGIGRVLESDGLITTPTVTLTASTWYYLYLYEMAGGLEDVEITTTAPSTPYVEYGYARRKSGTGGTSHRYLGAVRSSPGPSVLYNFTVEGNGNNPLVNYLEDTTLSPFRVLTAGSATTRTNVSCSSVVPPTARVARVRLTNTSDRNVRIFEGGSTNPSKGASAASATIPDNFITDVLLDDSQRFAYELASAPTSGGLYADVVGYFERR